MMFIDCRMVVVYGVTGSKYLECNSSIRTEKILNNQTKALNPTKGDRVNKSRTTKLAINNTGTELFSAWWKGWIVTVQYLWGLNIYVITELTIVTLFVCVLVHEASVVVYQILCFPAGSLVAFWKTIESPSTLCASCLNSRAVPVEFHNCNDTVGANRLEHCRRKLTFLKSL